MPSPLSTPQRPPRRPGQRRRPWPTGLLAALVAATTVVVPAVPAGAQVPGTYERQPFGVDGHQPNGATTVAGASADGRFVALTSAASNLVAGDTNGFDDVFVWDRQTGQVRRQPLGADGLEPNWNSMATGISADGTKVMFASVASNLVAGLAGNRSDFSYAFVWDLGTNKVVGQPAPGTYSCDLPQGQRFASTTPSAASGDMSKVALSTSDCSLVPGDTNYSPDVLVWRPATGALELQPPGVGPAQPDGFSTAGGLSADGATVLLTSKAANLVAGDTNNRIDAFAWTPSGYQRQPSGVDGRQPDGSTDAMGVSADGRLAVVESDASNLVAGDTNSRRDVFVWDRQTGTYARQPAGLDGRQPDGYSQARGISADGTKVLLQSVAGNYVCASCASSGDPEEMRTYLWDRTTGKVVEARGPVGGTGCVPPQKVPVARTAESVSGNGAVAVLSTADCYPGAAPGVDFAGLVAWDRTTGAAVRQPLGYYGQTPNGRSSRARVSFDGSKVAFRTDAWNLVKGTTSSSGDVNKVADVYVWNRTSGGYERQPKGVGGAEPNNESWPAAVSKDNSKVLMWSAASNLVPGDSNNEPDVFVWDRWSGTYQRQPLGVGGQQPNGGSAAVAISADRSKVLLVSTASNLVPGDTNGIYDLFVWDRANGTYIRQPNGVGRPRPDGSSYSPAMSFDGSKVALTSGATNLVAGDTNGQPDAFVWNRTTGSYERQPLGLGGAQPDGESRPAAVSKDNSKVLLTSTASNLVPGDTNGLPDVYVWNRWSGTYQRQPLGTGGAQPNGESTAVAVSADGTKVLLVSTASNLVAGDTNGVADVIVWDRSTGKYQRQAPGPGGQPNGASGGDLDFAVGVRPGGALSADAGTVFLSSLATNLVAGDTNNVQDAFAWTR